MPQVLKALPCWMIVPVSRYWMSWVATLMVKGLDQQDALDRLDRVMREIQTRFGLDAYVDASPPELPGHTP